MTILLCADPEAKKPADWDEEMDGEWEAPLIDNPACSAAPGCGTWKPPTIPNPNYKVTGIPLPYYAPLFDSVGHETDIYFYCHLV